ncbi:MAG: hypothetical protein ACTHU0_07235 [Kofleriaceae bacterium]
MSRHPAFALKFKTRLSFNAMWRALDRHGPWRWRASDSDAYGDKLYCYAEDSAKLQIIGEKPGWILQVSFIVGGTLPPDEVRRIVYESLLPAIGAREVEPTDTVM